MRGSRPLVAVLALAFGVAGLGAAGVLAQQGPTNPIKPHVPDAAKGREIAEKLCVGCHRVTPEQPPTQWADVPSFPEIANRPGRTADHLVGAIMMPHPPMPDIALSTPTLKDLAAFILTYKKP